MNNIDFLVGTKIYKLRNGIKVRIMCKEIINNSPRYYGHEINSPKILLIWYGDGKSPLGIEYDLMHAIGEDWKK